MDAWLNNPELRNSVRAQLDEWAHWARGSIRLPEPTHEPWTTPPDRDPPPVIDHDRAEATERVLTTWAITTDAGKRLTFLLKLRYIERRAWEDIAVHYRRRFKKSYTAEEIELLTGDAEWCFWMLTK